MKSLFLFNEAFTFGFNFDMLTVVFVGSIICGVGVITTKNPILSVLYLIGLFLNVAVYLMTVGIHFIGLSYLLVYVGAVSILFLFILMLINVRISELVTDNNNSIPLALMIGSIFSLTLYKLFPSSFKVQSSNFKQNGNDKFIFENNDLSSNSTTIFEQDSSTILEPVMQIFYNTDNSLNFVSAPLWDGALVELNDITSVGNVIYTVYPMWLILTSLILLLAMVGAIVITIKR